MAVKPTSRARITPVVKVVNRTCTKGAPYDRCWKTDPKRRPQQQQPITTVTSGRWSKHHYRLVDFRRNKDGIIAKGTVKRMDTIRTHRAHRPGAYADGERYILAPGRRRVPAPC